MNRPKLTRAQMRLAYEINRDMTVKLAKRLAKIDPDAFEAVLFSFRRRAADCAMGGKLTRDAMWWRKTIVEVFKRPIDPADDCPF